MVQTSLLPFLLIFFLFDLGLSPQLRDGELLCPLDLLLQVNFSDHLLHGVLHLDLSYSQHVSFLLFHLRFVFHVYIIIQLGQERESGCWFLSTSVLDAG